MERFKQKPLTIVGVNGDVEPADLDQAHRQTAITWRSFQNLRSDKKAISEEWQTLGWPTLYLIDHQGIIRKRWIGRPANDVLDREVDRLVEAALRAKDRDKGTN